jgi:hypothetical protein
MEYMSKVTQYEPSVDSMAKSDTEANAYRQYFSVDHKIGENLARYVVFNTGECTEKSFMHIIRSCLGTAWADGIRTISRVVNRKSPPRLVIGITRTLADHFRKNVRETFRDNNPRF